MLSFIIALPHEEPQAEKLARSLHPLGMQTVIHPAIKSDHLEGGCHLPGEWGCLMSHKQILERIVKLGIPACIFEYDAIPRKDISRELFHGIVESFLTHQGILFGSSQYTWNKVEKYRWKNIVTTQNIPNEPPHNLAWYPANDTTSGTFAMFVRPELAKYTLSMIDLYPDAMDRVYYKHVYQKFEVPVLWPPLFIADVAKSGIRQDRDPQTHALSTRWDIEQYGFEEDEEGT